MWLLVKNLCDFSDLSIVNYKDFTWKALQGKAAAPIPDVVHNQCIVVSKGNTVMDSGTPGHASSSPIYIPTSLISGLGKRSSRHFPLFWPITQSFSTPSPAPSLFPRPQGSIKLPGSLLFCVHSQE